MCRKSILLFAFLLINICVQSQSTASPDKIVEDQVRAYNAKDIELFCSFYSDTIRYYAIKDDFSTNTFIDGKEKLKAWFKNIFDKNPAMQCEITSRTILGSKILLKERFTSPNTNPLELVFIYVVQRDKIVSVGRIASK
jgi:hypothetical protein